MISLALSCFPTAPKKGYILHDIMGWGRNRVLEWGVIDCGGPFSNSPGSNG